MGIKRSKNEVLYQFVLYHTKGMCVNSVRKPIYIDAFDTVIYDLYGMKRYARKLSNAYDERQYYDIINKIGLDQLVELFENKGCCNAVRDLTQIAFDLGQLSDEIKKSRRKGRDPKYELKEFKDLKKLYTKGIKTLQKRLDIKSIRSAYKRKYGSLRDFVNDGYGSEMSWDNDFGLLDDIYDDDNDDWYSESTNLKDFMSMIGGGNGSRKSRKSSGRRQRNEYDDDDEPYHTDGFDELDDIYEYDNDESDEIIDEMSNKIDRLGDQVQLLANSVNGIITQNNYDETNHRDPVTHRSRKRRNTNPQPTRQTNQPMPYSEDIKDIKTSIIKMMDILKDHDNRMKDMEEDMYDDEEEMDIAEFADKYYHDDYALNPPDPNQAMQSSPHESDLTPEQRREALTDMINSNPQLNPSMFQNDDQ